MMGRARGQIVELKEMAKCINAPEVMMRDESPPLVPESWQSCTSDFLKAAIRDAQMLSEGRPR